MSQITLAIGRLSWREKTDLCYEQVLFHLNNYQLLSRPQTSALNRYYIWVLKQEKIRCECGERTQRVATRFNHPKLKLITAWVKSQSRAMISVKKFSKQWMSDTEKPALKIIMIINALCWSVNILSRKVLIGDTFFTSPSGDGTAILRGHPSLAKV